MTEFILMYSDGEISDTVEDWKIWKNELGDIISFPENDISKAIQEFVRLNGVKKMRLMAGIEIEVQNLLVQINYNELEFKNLKDRIKLNKTKKVKSKKK